VRKRTLVFGLTLVLGVAFSSKAQVSTSDEPSTFADRPEVIPSTEALLKMTPKDAVMTVAEKLGMVRGRKLSTIDFNTVEFTAAGTMSEPEAGGTWHSYKISKLVADMDFVIPGSRFDISLVDPDGHAKHEIRVVAEKEAWNEEKPGINGMPMPSTIVDDRIRQIWLTPQGAMWGALRAEETKGDSVMLGSEAGRFVISYPWHGDMIKVTFDAGLKPQRVELKAHSNAYGDTTLEATYSGYKDFEGYLAPFPTKMTYKAGSRTILDLNVTNCQVNPYIIFPTPENMPKSTAQQR
jgi:hypothetical protein